MMYDLPTAIIKPNSTYLFWIEFKSAKLIMSMHDGPN